MNERELHYLEVKSQPKMRTMKMQCGSESEINGQMRLPTGKRF